MKFETQLTKFMREYQSFLGEVSNYFSPYITKTKQEIEEFMSSKDNVLALENQKETFLSKFKSLPFPENIELTFKVHPTPNDKQVFKNKIMPKILEYPGGWIGLNYSLDGEFTEMEKILSELTGVPLIGNPVTEMEIAFKKCPKIQFTEPAKELKFKEGIANSSEHGYMEYFKNKSYFWSKNNKGEPKISSCLIEKIKFYEVIDIEFDISSLGVGEIDAYLNHLKIDDKLNKNIFNL